MPRRLLPLACALVLIAGGGCAPLPSRMPAPLPDFTVVVRDEAAAVVNVSGGYAMRPVLPDLPPPEDEEESDDEELRELLRRYLGPDALPEGRARGSGFLITSDGYIVTNAHLVEGADGRAVTVRLADRREFEARVVGADPASDIALLKIEAQGLPRVRIGNPKALRAGEWVAAIGSPFGFERSVTAGIVSAVARSLPEESYIPFIQTDVAVNPGNSGGPLFNLRGEVVGVNSAIYSGTGGYMGLSFAVPIDVAMEVAGQLRERGKVTRGRIGVSLQELTGELAAALALPRAAGALVVDVYKGSPAEAAGIRAADVIVRFDGKPVESDADLVRLTTTAQPGAAVPLELVRDGVQIGVSVVVMEARAPAAPRLPGAAKALPGDRLGLQLVPLDPKRQAQLALRGGVLVKRAEGAAQRAGLLPGDIVLSVNGKETPTVQAFDELVAKAGSGATVALLVQRDLVRAFLALHLPD